MCIETSKRKKVTFKNILKYLFLGVLAVFEPFQIIVQWYQIVRNGTQWYHTSDVFVPVDLAIARQN